MVQGVASHVGISTISTSTTPILHGNNNNNNNNNNTMNTSTSTTPAANTMVANHSLNNTTTTTAAAGTTLQNNNSKNPTTRLFDDNLNSLMDSNGEKKKKVGNYIISKVIGEGSFAKVRLGFHLVTQQKVAVKVINKREVLKRNYLRANLRREACMMQRMQHPNIIQLFEVMETENCYYIVMELIDGIEFVKYLSKKRTLDENETRQYVRQIVSAVDHMHRAKVIHRDIKLQNFMLDQSYNLVIIDFGLSNCLDERDFLNTQCGSPAYAAPEIFAHQDYRAEVDIWSIGVNMYAMLAGKLPFKVENRSKNLAKLHACILKGCEIPSYLTLDCQDLLRRLLDPSPNLRIKMNEIINHSWLNYHSFPIEIIPYKPVVDIKEIKPQIVQYLVQKHDYSESEIVDAIVYRKPIALKALYYLIDKRLKQGLTFPDSDFKLEDVESPLKLNKNPLSIDNTHSHVPTVAGSGGSGNSLIKQNSQLLTKRPSNLVARNSSQKNVDFKFVYNTNNNNNNSVNNRENEQPIISNGPNTYRPESTLSSKSPSPDISSIKYSRGQIAPKSNYQDIITRKSTSHTSSSVDRNVGAVGSLTRAESRTERYFMPVNTSTTAAEDQYHTMIRNRSNVNAAAGPPPTHVTTNGAGQIRSLPGSLYRGSPERSLPRSPDYTAQYAQQVAASNRGVTSRIGSSKLSVNSGGDRESYMGDTGQKFKVPNYYVTKRSMTSMDVDQTRLSSNTSSVLKQRQLPMGKAKIDLGNQQNLNVGITIKNIGAYLKVPNRSSPDTMKTFNSTQNKQQESIAKTTQNQAALKQHMHTPSSNNTTQTSQSQSQQQQQRLQTADSGNSLPRIRINS